jgi:exodeoxyribonuclease VII large subunit
MQQFEMFDTGEGSYSVSELTLKLRNLIEAQSEFQSVWVQGEVSNFSHPKSGHLYFTIKDDSAELRCVMWRSMAANQAYLPQDGDAIEVHGGISVYEARGQYQFYADEIRPFGEGALFQAFQILKSKLESEGLFDAEHKLPLPKRPEKIGIIASPSGAAFRDILNALARRFPLSKVILVPAAAQGKSAAKEMRLALQKLDTQNEVDVIIIARGGGSIEDLAAFNDEAFAREIFNAKTPIVSGVGHETDFTIADFVSDERAPTPTAAAELVSPELSELITEIDQFENDINQLLLGKIEEMKWSLNGKENALVRRSPIRRVLNEQRQTEHLEQRLQISINRNLTIEQSGLGGTLAKLSALNPQKILERGFAVVSDAKGLPIQKLAQSKEGMPISVRVSDGDFSAEIKKKAK